MQLPASKCLARIGQVAIVGAVLATLCDANHVLTDTLSYPEPFLFGQPAFTFPGFLAAFTAMALLYHYVLQHLPPSIIRAESMSTGTSRDAAESMLIFVFVYLMSGFGNHHPALLSLIFYGAFVVRLVFTYERAFMVIVAAILAFGGMFVEGLMTQFDLVHYRAPEVFGVPIWLGGVYAHGAFALRELIRAVVYRR